MTDVKFEKEPGVTGTPCLGQTEIFFGRLHERKDEYNARVAIAAEMCGMCAIKEACYEGACERRETEGIWGGVDFSFSNKMRKKRLRAKQAQQSQLPIGPLVKEATTLL